MTIKAISPMYPALSAAEVRTHLRNFDTAETSLIEAYLLASQDDIQIQCERSIVMRKFRITLPRFPYGSAGVTRPVPFANDRNEARSYGSAILLEMVPVASVESVAYYDTANDAQTYSDWSLFSDAEPAELRQDLATSWPLTYYRRDAATITFWAGDIVPLTVDTVNDQFVSVTGYPFADGDEVTFSSSGNTNPDIGDVAVLPDNISVRTTYYVRDWDADAKTFSVAATSGGTAIDMVTPATTGEAIDLVFAGEINPFHKLALLQMTAKAFGERCPQGGCVCTAEDFKTNPLLMRLKWRSPVAFVG